MNVCVEFQETGVFGAIDAVEEEGIKDMIEHLCVSRSLSFLNELILFEDCLGFEAYVIGDECV